MRIGGRFVVRGSQLVVPGLNCCTLGIPLSISNCPPAFSAALWSQAPSSPTWPPKPPYAGLLGFGLAASPRDFDATAISPPRYPLQHACVVVRWRRTMSMPWPDALPLALVLGLRTLAMHGRLLCSPLVYWFHRPRLMSCRTAMSPSWLPSFRCHCTRSSPVHWAMHIGSSSASTSTLPMVLLSDFGAARNCWLLLNPHLLPCCLLQLR